MLPSGGLPGYQNAINNLSLTLVASHNIVNNGAITSADNLTALAGGSITNAPTAGPAAGLPRVQAAGELNLLSGAVANQGVVSSSSGNVDLAVPSNYASAAGPFASGTLPGSLPQYITINNTSGTIQALEGTINLGGMELGQSALLTLTGGNLAASAINVQAGEGAIKADVNNVTGAVNVSGGGAQFGSDSGVLDLGTLDLAGDPTIFNNGDIEITKGFSVTEGLAILASGNITASAAVTIQTGGNNVYMVAGVNPSSLESASMTLEIPPLPAGQSFEVTGGSASGGSILLAGSSINTSPTSMNQSGGSVTLVAYGGTGSGGISGVNITSGGTGTGSNGSVTMIAGGTLGSTTTAISGISITASGGTGKALPAINVFAAQPLGSVSFSREWAPLRSACSWPVN